MQRETEGKKKWLEKKGFNAFVPNADMKEKFSDHHYVTADASEPPMLHKFRTEEKETFMYGAFKV
jgi:hypothetical protein